MSVDRTTAPAVSEIGRMAVKRPVTMTLDNGVELTVLDSGEMEINRLTVMTDGGVTEAPMAEIAMVTPDALREGTTTRSGADIANVLEDNGAWVKSLGHMHHTTLTTFSLNSRFDDVLPVVLDMLENPTFPEREVASIVDRAAARMEVNLSRVGYHASMELERLVKGANHPSVKEATPEQIRNIGPDALREWHSRTLAPGHCRVFLSGRVDDRMVERVERAFGARQGRGEGVEPLYVSHTPSGNHERVFVERPGALQSAVAMGCSTISRESEDYVDLRIAVMALGGYFGSRLMANIREDKGYTYGIGAALLGGREGAMVQISTEAGNEYRDAVVDEVLIELERLKDASTFGADELDRLKRHLMTSLASTLDTPFTMMEYYENMVLSSTPADYFERQQRAIRAIDGERIARVAQKYLKAEDFYTVIAGPAD